MDNLTLKLKRPVTVDALEYTELTMRDLTVAENLALEKQNANKSTMEQDVSFFSLMCGVSPQVILSLKNNDWMRLKNLYWATLGNVTPEQESSE